MTFDDPYYLHFLNTFAFFGPKRLSRLANYFPDYTTAFQASEAEFTQAGIEPKIIAGWLDHKKSLKLDAELKQLNDQGVNLLTYEDESYPRLLRQIDNPPRLLYYRGKLSDEEELCIGVVGTRKISAYGHSVTPLLVTPLVEAGLTIVSGLAYGVDALAHKTTVSHSGRTIAVLAGGLNDEIIYPRNHVKLANDIIDGGGLLLSEHAPNRQALRQNFVVRNRIISGLSRGILIVECDFKSGALITAEAAVEQQRAVYAVPGSIYSPSSQGTNELLKTGKAKLVTSGRDILRNLQQEIKLQIAPQSFVSLTPEEQTVLALISQEPVLADHIIATLGQDPSITTAALTFLEIKGYIKNLGAQQYIRVK